MFRRCVFWMEVNRMIELRVELKGYVAVLYKDTNGKPILNNIDAYSYEGTKLWNIKETLDSALGTEKDEWYPDMGAVDGHLSVYAFRGIRYLLDGETGKLLEKRVVK